MPKVFIISGPNEGKSINFESNIAYLGRLPDNEIQIKEKTISRKHLRIQTKGSGFIIRDLNSKNGTFLDGKRLEPGIDIEVKGGVPISVGRVIISLGVECSEAFFSTQEMEELAREFSTTAMFTAHMDRPLTLPKNMDFFYKVSTVLSQSLDIDEIMKKVLDYIFELLKRIDRGVVILIDDRTNKISNVISRSATSEETSGSTSDQYSKTIVNKVIQTGKPIVMLDTFGQDDTEVSESMELMQVRSVMCVPLISKSEVRGIIYVDSLKTPYGFREEDLSILTALGSPAAIAIENALLYSGMEDVIKERTQNLKSTEKMLRESEKRFKAIFKNMSSGVIVCRVVDNGKDFLILDLNQACSKIEKVKKRDVTGKSFLDVFPILRENNLPDVFKRVWETGKSERHLITLSRDGDIIGWRNYYVYALPDDEIVAIFDDITAQKEVEIEQKALQDQLFAAQKMETIGAFAGGTAHSFRNILQAISGNIEYLEAVYGKNPEVKDLAKSIYNSIDKGVDLINNLLHFSKKGWEMEMDYLDLAEVIVRTYQIIEKVFNKNIAIKLDLGEDLLVKGNFSLLSQAFMNLFTNARDAMPNGGELQVKTKKMQNTIIVNVSDTGHGIEKDVIDRIFDPFFTLKEVGAGTGLGLSTTLGIIEQHSGSITVSSKYGEGTTFKIVLPATDGKVKERNEPQNKIVLGKEQKILVIDDDADVLNSMAGLIKKLGYEVIAIDKPADAIQNYKKWSPDLVLIDRNMPELDGITCIKKFMETDPKAKIVIISGYEEAGPDGIDEDIKGMIKGYLTKPCGMGELSRMISKALGN